MSNSVAEAIAMQALARADAAYALALTLQDRINELEYQARIDS